MKVQCNGWLFLIVLSVILLAMALLIHSTHPARAHDHNRPGLIEWLKTLQNRNSAACCNGDDTDAIEDWETKDSRYRVKFRGVWYDVPDSALVDGPNKGGDALLWMNKGWGGISVRCFMPGTLS